MVLLLAVTGLAGLTSPTLPAAPPAQRWNEYRPMPFMGGGYRDKRRAPNRWWVRGFSLGGQALELALYRGALRVSRDGYRYMQVVKIHLVATESLPGIVANNNAEFELVGVNDPNAPIACENRKRNVDMCRTLGTDDAMQEFGHRIGRTDAEIATDLAAISEAS